jgi:ankyrin repeat protein
MFIRSAFGIALITLCAASGCSGSTASQEEVVDPTALDPGTGIMVAAEEGKLELVTQMVESNPELIRFQGNKRRTALHAAAATGQQKVVDYLISQGADPNAVDENGEKPEDVARQNLHESLSKHLEELSQQGAGATAPAP